MQIRRQGQNDQVKSTLRCTMMLACLGLLLVAWTGSAAATSGHANKGHSKKARTETFEGSCAFSGAVQFSPPLGTSQQPTHAVADLAGHCSGSLTKSNRRTRQLDQSPVRYHAESDGMQSCAAGNASGQGFFDFGRSKIDFALSETRVGAIAPLMLNGRGGGTFSGTATASGDPAETAMACAGAGLSRSDVTISGSTTPKISG